MTTEAQRLTEAQILAGELMNTPFESTRHEAAALLRRQEAALMRAKEALERVAEAMPFPVATKTIATINELLGEQT